MFGKLLNSRKAAQLMTLTILHHMFFKVVPTGDSCSAMYTNTRYYTMFPKVIYTTLFPDARSLLSRCPYILLAITGHPYLCNISVGFI